MPKNVQAAEAFPNLVRMNWTVSTSEDRPVASPVVEELSTPILLLDAEARMEYSNLAATRLLRDSDGLYVHANVLMTMTPKVTMRLHAAVRNAISIGHPDVFAIPRRSGRLPYVIRLSRIHSSGPQCMAVVVDPDQNVAPDPETLVELFNLTHAEARLAAALARGETVGDFAEQFRIKVSTVRSHLRTVFAKTGTARQSDLIRLLLTIGVRLRTP